VPGDGAGVVVSEAGLRNGIFGNLLSPSAQARLISQVGGKRRRELDRVVEMEKPWITSEEGSGDDTDHGRR
jgi:hypothetical protein